MNGNGNEPATKQDLAAVRQDVDQLRSAVRQDIDQLRSEMKQNVDQLSSDMKHIHDDLVERMADGETRLLKAFYNFAQTNSKRMTEIEGSEAFLRTRVATLEDRLLEVEKRLNIPPTA